VAAHVRHDHIAGGRAAEDVLETDADERRQLAARDAVAGGDGAELRRQPRVADPLGQGGDATRQVVARRNGLGLAVCRLSSREILLLFEQLADLDQRGGIFRVELDGAAEVLQGRARRSELALASMARR
jgi:hypothetical protein